MKTRIPKIENSRWNARSVLECGSPLSLSHHQPTKPRSSLSARGLAQSKTWRQFVALFCLCVLPSAFCLRAQGQYTIDWHTIDGGGCTSTGGVYSLTGTIGQPDAGVMSGGNYTLHGGFWGIMAAVQTPGAPWLSLARSNGVVIVSWPKPADGWMLEYRTDLTSGTWTQIPAPYSTNATDCYISEPSPSGNRFYRLHKP